MNLRKAYITTDADTPVILTSIRAHTHTHTHTHTYTYTPFDAI
jgi:hypothetical protein